MYKDTRNVVIILSVLTLLCVGISIGGCILLYNEYQYNIKFNNNQVITNCTIDSYNLSAQILSDPDGTTYYNISLILSTVDFPYIEEQINFITDDKYQFKVNSLNMCWYNSYTDELSLVPIEDRSVGLPFILIPTFFFLMCLFMICVTIFVFYYLCKYKNDKI